MTLPTGSERDFDQAKQLLEEYSFDLEGYQAGELTAIWKERLEVEPSWIRTAVLEALYQGRYKAFSVEQILHAWKRRGYPLRHFNSEFERVVLGPIDPTLSRYAAISGQRPSELLTTSFEQSQAEPETLIAAEPQSKAGQDVSTGAGTNPEPTLPVNPSPSSPILPNLSGKERSQTTPIELDKSLSPPETSGIAETRQQVTPLATHFYAFSQLAPIRKFVPKSESSEFYHRLQSVAGLPAESTLS
jgi:hypothetical protein